MEAEDGLAAWRLLAEQTFHIALVDLMMPNLNGFGLIQCMRGHPRTRHMPIVVVTSNEDRASIDKALEVGASAFMTKPLKWFVFNSHVSHLLRMATQAEAAELEMARAQAVSASHATFAAAAGAFAHHQFHRIAVAAEIAKGPEKMTQVARDAQAAHQECERLRLFENLVSDNARVNGTSQHIGKLLQAAAAVAEAELGQQRIRISMPGNHNLRLLCNQPAIVLTLLTMLRTVADRADPGSELLLGATNQGDGVHLSATVANGAWSKLDEGDLDADFVLAAQTNRHSTAYELAACQLLAAAHCASLIEEGEEAGEHRLTLRFPADRAMSECGDASIRPGQSAA